MPDITSVLRRVRLPPTLQAAIVLAGLIVAFLWTPLTRDGYYAASDLLQDYAIHRVAPPAYRPKNNLLSDPVNQMLPFLEWNRAELLAGRLPVWNPYNGWGAPHLANYQSAVFSPFSLPYYLLGFRAGLLVTPALQLFLIGLFTYLFLRQLALRYAAALGGAAAFMFGGYQILWLHHRNVPVVVALPAGLYCAERALQSGTPAGRIRALAGVTVALTIGLLCGNPETFFFSALLLGTYLAFRLLRCGVTWRERAGHVAGFGLAGLLALALAAAQLLPFVEYLRESHTLVNRSGEPFAFKHGEPAAYRELIPLQAFPDLLGSPAREYYDLVAYRQENYIEANTQYAGLAVLFLAGLAIAGLPRHRSASVVFFAAAALAWWLYIYNVAGLGELTTRLPLMQVAVPTRSQPIWLFSVSCLAALALHSLLTARGSEPPAHHARWVTLLPAAGAASWGLALLGAALLGARALLDWAARLPGAAVNTPVAQALVSQHIAYLSLTLLVAVAAVTLALLVPPQRRGRFWEGWLGGTLVIVIFLQTGFLLRDFHPTIEGRYFFPVSPALAAVRERVGAEQTLWLDGAGMMANVNLWYRLRSLSNYDSLNIRGYEVIHRALIQQPHPALELAARPAGLRALQLLGVQYVATAAAFPLATPASTPVSGEDRRTTPILPDRPLSQRFRATADGLSGITVRLATYGRRNGCMLRLRLEDENSGQHLAEMTQLCREVDEQRPVVFHFPPQPNSRGRWYRLHLSSPDATNADAVGAVYVPRSQGSGLRAGVPGSDLPIGQLVFQAFAAAAIPELRPVWTDGTISLFQVPGSRPRYGLVRQGRLVMSDEEALALLLHPDTDPLTTVVLQASAGGAGVADTVGRTGAPDGQVELVEETATRVRLRVTQHEPAWLVAMQTYYPGWVARIDGQPAELVRANIGFTAVAVEAGVHEVELAYEPASVRLGLAISAGALLLVLATLVLAGRRRGSHA